MTLEIVKFMRKHPEVPVSKVAEMASLSRARVDMIRRTYVERNDQATLELLGMKLKKMRELK